MSTRNVHFGSFVLLIAFLIGGGGVALVVFWQGGGALTPTARVAVTNIIVSSGIHGMLDLYKEHTGHFPAKLVYLETRPTDPNDDVSLKVETMSTARDAMSARHVGHIPLTALGLSLSSFFAMSFLGCILLGLIVPDIGMHRPWLQFFPGFEWVTARGIVNLTALAAHQAQQGRAAEG